MTNHRALTLIEVLASIVLLTILAGSCVPLLQRAMRTLGEQQPRSVSMVELGLLANKLMQEPATFSIDDLSKLDSLSLPCPEHPDRDPVEVKLLTAAESVDVKPSEERIPGIWLRLACDGQVIYRWLPAPPEEDQGASEPSSKESRP